MKTEKKSYPNWKPHNVTCPKCGGLHHIFDAASPFAPFRYAVCGQAYYQEGGPVPASPHHGQAGRACEDCGWTTWDQNVALCLKCGSQKINPHHGQAE